ncbi:DinB family protein [Leptolyngbya sp. 7M]|uniref:DinB family protein n=1 Tax=Leptolyngbya sp. 7M TaxID=2812896 RepID=UPI001B8D6816|nr:DinB family protein [Leptolyngbya sp. 7M]QYO66146.1 DinB family protein [Leptolyngbya sp. 7M]
MQAVTSAQMASADLAEAYRRVRARTEELCEPLEIEDYIPQPIVDVSPPKWNIAHTTWFFEEMLLKRFAPGYQVFDPNFGFLFNSYYNSVGERTSRDHRGDLSRPTVKRVFEYRKYVDQAMLDLLSGKDSKAYQPELTDEPTLSPSQRELFDLVVLGLNHEQQHQELFLTDLKYTFAQNPLFPVYKAGSEIHESERPNAGFINVPAGIYEIGHSGDGFCFDNELSKHRVFINDFSISNRLVTNSEFLEFIADNGYKDHRLWHSEGWDWINRDSVSSPLYWHFHEGAWSHYTLGGFEKLPPADKG